MLEPYSNCLAIWSLQGALFGRLNGEYDMPSVDGFFLIALISVPTLSSARVNIDRLIHPIAPGPRCFLPEMRDDL